MTATVMNSRFSAPNNRPLFARRANRYVPQFFYTAEVEDYDGETHSFEIMAESNADAADKAQKMAWSYGISAYHINIYK